MTHLPEDQKREEKKPGKRPYQSPQLVVYGAVRDLARGGTGKAQESSSGQKRRP
jgi:hypothetical protein